MLLFSLNKSLHIPLFAAACFPQGISTSQHSAVLLLPRVHSGACSPFGPGAQSSQGRCRLWQDRQSEFNLLTEIQSEQLPIFWAFLRLSEPLAWQREAVLPVQHLPRFSKRDNVQRIKELGCKRVAAAFRTVREALLQTNEPSICSKTLFSKHSMKTVILPGWSLEER